jgi:GT2 family glycosyltransferase
MSKIGVGLITFNRPEYYKKVLNSIPIKKIDTLVIVNDGENVYVDENDGNLVLKNLKQLGVSKSKNIALKELIEKFDCEHLFLIEDDIVIKDENVFDVYIKAANSTGIHHMCYEKIANNQKTLKYIQNQPDGTNLGFYHNPQGAFMYINANLIKKLGYFDENYLNAFEHIDFAYNLAQKKVAPPFWYFPDLLNSEEYLTDIENSSENSTITNKEKYEENWQNSAKYFIKKWGVFTNQIKEIDKKLMPMFLMFLEQNYSRKKNINKDKKLAIIIPYRDRINALNTIIPKLKEYISNQVNNFDIFVIEQNNNKPFNKGILNNLGFLLTPNYDYYCFHDVDLIPEYSDYSFPEKPTHLSSHCSQFNYINIPDKIMGGVVTFQKEHFLKVNGYPCTYSGWGKEDDCLYLRCETQNLTPFKHPFGRYYSVPHQHRLTDPTENELHLKNGEKFLNEKNGITNMWDDGLNKLNISNYSIEIEDKKVYKHIKIDV